MSGAARHPSQDPPARVLDRIIEQLPDELQLHPDYSLHRAYVNGHTQLSLRHSSGTGILTMIWYPDRLAILNHVAGKWEYYEYADPAFLDQLQATCSSTVNVHQTGWHKAAQADAGG